MWYINNPSVRAFSDFQARMFQHTSANMISLYRIIMALIFPLLIWKEWHALGITFFAIAVYLDFVDGAVARYQQDIGGFRTDPETERELSFLSRLRLKGCTETGKWLDPFADKFLNQVALFTLGWLILPTSFLYLSLTLAIALTLVRPFKAWLLKKGWRKSADGRANIFGKLKMWLEVATITLLFITSENIFENILQRIVQDVLMGVAIFTACLSLIFHLLPSRQNK